MVIYAKSREGIAVGWRQDGRIGPEAQVAAQWEKQFGKVAPDCYFSCELVSAVHGQLKDGHVGRMSCEMQLRNRLICAVELIPSGVGRAYPSWDASRIADDRRVTYRWVSTAVWFTFWNDGSVCDTADEPNSIAIWIVWLKALFQACPLVMQLILQF